MARELLFSLTKSDFRFDYYRASGKGGQKRNKTSSAVRIHHDASGAIGECSEHREQSRNKHIAFQRLHDHPRFKAWLRLETAKRLGHLAEIEATVDRMMQDVKAEVRDENGRWVEAESHTEKG